MSGNFQNRISLWRNENKEDDSHADFTGTLNVEGVEYFVDVWKRGPDEPEKRPPLSGRIKRKQKQGQGGGGSGSGSRRSREEPPEELDDDIPFATRDGRY